MNSGKRGNIQRIPIPRHCSLGKRRTGRVAAGKLDRHMVEDIRRSSRREWFGLALRQQARLAQRRYPVHEMTICDLLANRSWADPAYDRTAPDLAFWSSEFAAIFLFLRICHGG